MVKSVCKSVERPVRNVWQTKMLQTGKYTSMKWDKIRHLINCKEIPSLILTQQNPDVDIRVVYFYFSIFPITVYVVKNKLLTENIL